LTHRALPLPARSNIRSVVLYTPYNRRDGISRLPLAHQVAAHLRQRIYDRELAPGQRLDEAAVASGLKVSRTPVREAFRQLAAWGLVEIRARRGCFVVSLTLEDLAQIFPIMARLEGWVAHEVAARAGPEELARLKELHGALERHAGTGDTDLYWEANYVFHMALQEMTGNAWLQRILGELRGKLNLARHRSLKLPGRMRRSLEEHRALLRALQRHQADRAEILMREHLSKQLEALKRLEPSEE
jgi:DNA-binding GntR family transcriptional regulator